MYIRQDWVEKTQFYPETQSEVLLKIFKEAQNLSRAGAAPVVLFDLDSTLFHVNTRSYEIIREWLGESAQSHYPEIFEKLKNLQANELKYSIDELWSDRKISFEGQEMAAFNELKKFWRKRFFSHDFLKYDEPTLGAQEYVTKLYESGVQVIYLTGRDTPLMGFGTFDQLKRHKFPIEVPRTRLILKPKRHMDDMLFKTQVIEKLLGQGEVVAHFENEPKNIVAMAKKAEELLRDPKRFKMMNIFVQSVSSDHPAPAFQGIYKISDFKV